MQENSLYKAGDHLGSIKERAKKLGIQPKPIYALIKGVSSIPLEYAFQIDYLSNTEIPRIEAIKNKVFLTNLCSILHKFIVKTRQGGVNSL